MCYTGLSSSGLGIRNKLDCVFVSTLVMLLIAVGNAMVNGQLVVGLVLSTLSVLAGIAAITGWATFQVRLLLQTVPPELLGADLPPRPLLHVQARTRLPIPCAPNLPPV